MGNLPSLPAVGSGYGGGFSDTRFSFITGGRFSLCGLETCFGSVNPTKGIGGAGGAPFGRLAGCTTLFGRLGVGYDGGAGAGSVTP
jgi:hypothetical protein